MEEKKGPGRPRLETTMDPEWYKIIIDAGKKGHHITRFLKELGISWEGHYTLLNRNKKYYEAFMEYQKLCEEWWYNIAHEAMVQDGGQKFNSRLWQIIVKNKFKENWKDNNEIDITSKGESINSKSPIQIEVIRKSIDENNL